MARKQEEQEDIPLAELLDTEVIDNGYEFSILGGLNEENVRTHRDIPAHILASIGFITLHAEEMVTEEKDDTEFIWSAVRASTLATALKQEHRSVERQKAGMWLDGWITGLEQSNPNLRLAGGPIIDIMSAKRLIKSKPQHQEL